LSKIHNPRIIHRLHDNMLKVNSKENMLSIFELFEMTSNELWIELEKFDEINSFRRETQSFYIDLLAIVYFDTDNMFPRDTKSIAYSTLKKIKSNISEALPYYVFDDETTYAHLRAMIDKIDSVIEAQLIKG